MNDKLFGDGGGKGAMSSNVDEDNEDAGQFDVDKTPSFFSQRFASDLLRDAGNVNDENYNSENLDVNDLNNDPGNFNSLVNKVSM